MSANSFAAFVLTVSLDQITKYFARQQIFFKLPVIENPGLPFFGINLPGFFDLVLILGMLVLFLSLLFRNFQKAEKSFAFGLILGGAVSNIFDRLFKGAVTDFINIGLMNTFNFADVAIIIGIVIIISKKLRPRRTKIKNF